MTGRLIPIDNRRIRRLFAYVGEGRFCALLHSSAIL